MGSRWPQPGISRSDALNSSLLRLQNCSSSTPISLQKGIPDAIVLKGADKLELELSKLAENKLQFNRACQVLLNYSLIKRSSKEAAISIHRLVQAVLQDSLDQDIQRAWAGQAVRVLEHVFYNATEGEIEQYIPHAQACALYIKKFHLEGQEVAYLLKMVAKAVDAGGWYAQARPLYVQAYKAYVASFGAEDRQTRELLLDVVHIYLDLGAPSYAEAAYQRLIDELERTLGSDHLSLLTLLNRLAWAQMASQNYSSVVQISARALELLSRSPTVGPLEQAETYQVVAAAFELVQEYDLAEAYTQEALALFEQVYGTYHEEVATTLMHYGGTAMMRRDFEKAESLFLRGLAIRQQVLGRGHPETAECLIPLAVLSWRRRDYAEAEGRYHQALAIHRQTLGPYHPDVVRTLRHLAKITAEQNKDVEAEGYFLEAIDLAPQAGGKETYEYYLLLRDYANFLQERGRLDEANTYNKQILDLEQLLRTRGPLHRLTLMDWDEEGKPRPSKHMRFS